MFRTYFLLYILISLSSECLANSTKQSNDSNSSHDTFRDFLKSTSDTDFNSSQDILDQNSSHEPEVTHDDDDDVNEFLEHFEDEDGDHSIYVNEFAVELEGNIQEAELVASIYGFKVKKLRYLDGVYLFTHPTTPARSKRSADDVLGKLRDDPHVHYVEQQQHLSRTKRGSYRQRYAKAVQDAYDEVNRILEQRLNKRTIGSIKPDFNDPQYGDQWYLAPSRVVTRSAGRGLDLNTAVVWSSGYTGRGVVVSVLDDGLQHNHTDIQANYDPLASCDLNDEDDDPTPNFAVDGNDHGTMCSGEIAAVADNNRCGIGVAYNCKIGGVRMLDGRITDVLEGSALGFGVGHIDIYSSSWGPTDDGTKMQAPGHYAMAGLMRGITEGRGGKGSIYVWASGNGGVKGDTGNADGYVSSIYTIAIGSLDEDGESNYYNEPASSIMAMVVTGGRKGYGQPGPPGNVVTTGWHDRCVQTFGGTSAAAPLMAGCLALVLEANPTLTWRDVQHVVVSGARLVTPDEARWTINGAGRHVSPDFGFGLADCGLMVQLAQDWTNVAEQRLCRVQDAGETRSLPPASTVTLNLTTTACSGQKNQVTKLEHVEVKVGITHPVRGQVQLTLISPSGTRSVVLKTRKRDQTSSGIDFTFMSVHFWDEDPRGTWRLEVADKPTHGSGNQGEITHFSLTLYGTSATDVDDEKQPVRRRSSTSKHLKEIHEEEMRRSRRVTIRKKRTSDDSEEKSAKPKFVSEDEKIKSVRNKQKKTSEKDDFVLNDEEREIVKRLLDELEDVKLDEKP